MDAHLVNCAAMARAGQRVEIVEDIAKLNWSKLAKGVLSAKKRKIELLEAEMGAPGRECAHVVHARKRFGSS